MPQFSSDSHRVNCTKLTTRVEVDSLEITISSILIIKSKNNITKDFARFRYRKELWTGYFNLKFSNDTFETTSPLPSPPLSRRRNIDLRGERGGEERPIKISTRTCFAWHEHYSPFPFPPREETTANPSLLIPTRRRNFRTYCPERIPRTSPLSNELTFRETSASGFNFEFPWFSAWLARWSSPPSFEYAFNAIG